MLMKKKLGTAILWLERMAFQLLEKNQNDVWSE